MEEPEPVEEKEDRRLDSDQKTSQVATQPRKVESIVNDDSYTPERKRAAANTFKMTDVLVDGESNLFDNYDQYSVVEPSDYLQRSAVTAMEVFEGPIRQESVSGKPFIFQSCANVYGQADAHQS